MPRHPGRAPKPPVGNRFGSHGRKAAEALGRTRTPCPTSKACSCSSRSCASVIVTGSSTQIARSEEHTSELQSRLHLVCRLLLEKKKATDFVIVGSHERRH